MTFFLDIAQVIISAVLIVCILLQAKQAGLSAAFGGGGNISTTRRGAEKGIFIISIILAVFFLVLGALRMFINE